MHPSKRKGGQYEREAVALIHNATGYDVHRLYGEGQRHDRGDLGGVPDTTIQVKGYPSDLIRAIRETLDELPKQQATAGTTFAAGMVRRPGGRWAVVLTPEQFFTLLREALS